ncbi:oligosaccharide flippase family protein, partial [Vibrio mytili]
LVILKSGWDVFLTSLASSVYLTLIPIVIGVFHGPISVGYFNVADTIKKICISFFTPIYQSVFPKVNSLIVNDKPKASEIVKRYFYISSILALLGTAFVAFYVIEIIILVSGSEFIPARETVLIMMVVVIVSVANNFFGIQSLIPTKNEKVLRKIVVAGATLCLIMMGPVIYYFDYIGSAFLVLSVEAFVFVLLGLYHFRFNVGMIFDWGVKP